MGKIIVDTNILIYILKGDDSLSRLLDAKQVYISYITELELLSYPKLKNTELEIIQESLDKCRIIIYNDVLKESVIRLRKKYNLKLPDAIIAASAEYYFIPLLTADNVFGKITEIETSVYSIK